MPRDVRAFWIAAPGRGEIRRETLASRGADDVIVRALYSGISRGTEALVFEGRVPETERERMRAPFQQGDFPAPVKYGYASVGLVEDGPPALVNQTVFVLFPHQTHYVVPGHAVRVVPPTVPPARAVLAANMETAINGLWDARPHVGDRVTVIGAGTVGCLTAWLASRIAGCDVELIDVNAQREDVARALGVRFAPPDAAAREADVVFHTSGSPEGLQLALDLAAFETTVVELSWYGNTSVSLPLGRGFHPQRLSIKSSQVGTIPAAQRARWTYARRIELAIAMLADATLDVLISGETSFDDMPDAMRGILAAGETLCHRIRYV